MSELALKRIEENKARRARGKDARVLDLSNCGMVAIPDKIGELVWLTSLKLTSGSKKNQNRISKLPSSIVNISRLKSLDLSEQTKLSDIKFLENLLDLESLSLSKTSVRNLYPLTQLKQLKRLYLRKTNVFSLSPISSLDELSELDLSGTYVHDSDLFPISQLKKIARIDISNTYVTDLSPLKSLINRGIPVLWNFEGKERRIYVNGCDLIHPPIEIVKQGNKAILNYFAEREKKLQFKNTEIKLILTGNSTAGKTSLSQYLRERTFKEDQPTTHGILNQQWHPEGREMQVNLWDFGGQEYYHATHRLFLSRNAVYVLVWDKETDKGGFCETNIQRKEYYD